MIESIQEIKYKNKVINTGLVIGKRKYRWTLKQKYQPCWAKNGTYISELSPHKKDFTVFIPYRELKKNEGKEIKIGDTNIIKIIKLNEVQKTFCDIEVLEVKPYEKWKSKRRKTNTVETDISEDFPI